MDTTKIGTNLQYLQTMRSSSYTIINDKCFMGILYKYFAKDKIMHGSSEDIMLIR